VLEVIYLSNKYPDYLYPVYGEPWWRATYRAAVAAVRHAQHSVDRLHQEGLGGRLAHVAHLVHGHDGEGVGCARARLHRKGASAEGLGGGGVRGDYGAAVHLILVERPRLGGRVREGALGRGHRLRGGPARAHRGHRQGRVWRSIKKKV